jgi:cyanate permease
MRRAWAAIAAVWALLAIVAVLAWSHPPVQSPSSGSTVVVVKGKKGHAVVLPRGLAAHTTTHSSPPPR